MVTKTLNRTHTNFYLYSPESNMFQRCVCVCILCAYTQGMYTCTHTYINTVCKLCIHIYICITYQFIYTLGKETRQLKIMGEKETCFSLHNLLCLLNSILVYFIS